MAWQWRSTRRSQQPHIPAAQNVLTRLDAVVDRLEGAFQRLEDLAPAIDEYADSLTRLPNSGGE